MRFIKSLFFIFLFIFFVNYMFPGTEVTNRTKLPHLGADFPFAFILGFFNTLIYPTVQRFRRKSPVFQVFAMAIILNFAVYGSLHFLNLGITVASIRCYALVATVITVASIIANLLEMRGKHLYHNDFIQQPKDPLP
jgi:hypothetical protein